MLREKSWGEMKPQAGVVQADARGMAPLITQDK